MLPNAYSRPGRGIRGGHAFGRQSGSNVFGAFDFFGEAIAVINILSWTFANDFGASVT